MTPCFFIFGCGYTANALTPKLIAQGFRVIGTSRTPQTPTHHNPTLQLIDFNSPCMENYLHLATHLLICIPPTSALNDIVLLKYGNLIKKQAPYLKWLGYLSSTSVYGNHDGNWVTEESHCIPHTPTGTTRLHTEQDWILFAQKHQLPLHIFRLSGIYGSGRNALERIIHGKKQSIFKENQVFSRIHVEDIATTLLASMQQPNPSAIYNVADDEPAPADTVDRYAAKLLHREPLPLIPFSEAHLSPMEQAFYANNRRVSNLKIKEQLHVSLQYPTYREGLTQIWRSDFSSQ